MPRGFVADAKWTTLRRWRARRGGAGRGCINFADEVNVDSWLKLSAMAGSREWTVSLLRVTFPPNGKTQGGSVPCSDQRGLDEICERLANTPGMSIEVGENLLRLHFLAPSSQTRGDRKIILAWPSI